MKRVLFLLFLSFFIVTGCGGGGSGNETPGDRQPTVRTAIGQFKDANVAPTSKNKSANLDT